VATEVGVDLTTPLLNYTRLDMKFITFLILAIMTLTWLEVYATPQQREYIYELYQNPQ